MKTKTLIIGMARSGKDTLSELLEKHYGYTFTSSSWAAAELFIYDALKEAHGYTSVEECYNDRHTGNNRALWFNLITEYNKDDPARLAKYIVANNDIYCGMRSKAEVDECRRIGLFDLIIWVDASERVEYVEPPTSIDITEKDADLVVYNNGTLDNLKSVAEGVARKIIYLEGMK